MYTIPNQPFVRRGDPLNKGLVGCWLMQEPNGPNTRDISGRGNHATLVPEGEDGPTRVMTEMGRGIDCVHANESYLATPMLMNPTLPGSFFLWIRWNDISFNQNSGCMVTGNRLYLGLYSASFWAGCGSVNTDSGATKATLGTWYHFGLTWNGSYATCWLDGSLIFGFAYTSAGLITNSLHIGNINGSAGLESTATFTSATIYSRVLAPAEIRRLAGLDGDPWLQWRPMPKRRDDDFYGPPINNDIGDSAFLGSVV